MLTATTSRINQPSDFHILKTRQKPNENFDELCTTNTLEMMCYAHRHKREFGRSEKRRRRNFLNKEVFQFLDRNSLLNNCRSSSSGVKL